MAIAILLWTLHRRVQAIDGAEYSLTTAIQGHAPR